MSFSGERYDINNGISQSLSVTQCGITVCSPGHHVPLHVYAHYSVTFILEGKGEYKVNGKTYKLSAGQGFLIEPGELNSYTADEKQPWKYIYAVFSGIGDKHLVYYAGLINNDGVFNFDMTEDFLNTLYLMYNSGKNSKARGYDTTSYFLKLMSSLVEKNSENTYPGYLPSHYVNNAVTYIEDNYFRNINVNDVAKYVGIDRSYLYKLFQKNLKISPKKYIFEYRLRKAEQILLSSNASIEEISEMTGFFDESHFCKAFMGKYGETPGKYRRINNCK